MQWTELIFKTCWEQQKGALSFFEADRDVPFEFKRMYYIYGVQEGIQRGGHAHKRLWQVLWCPYGKIEIRLDDGQKKECATLDRPEKGMLLGPGVWRDMLWREDNSVLCVAASDYYDENDYIRDYQVFLEYIKEQDK